MSTIYGEGYVADIKVRRYMDAFIASLLKTGHAIEDVRAVLREYASAPQAAWDASQIKQPDWAHVQAAFIEGAREARANPEATDEDFRRASDGYTKRVFEEVDPVSEEALRTGSWRAA